MFAIMHACTGLNVTIPPSDSSAPEKYGACGPYGLGRILSRLQGRMGHTIGAYNSISQLETFLTEFLTEPQWMRGTLAAWQQRGPHIRTCPVVCQWMATQARRWTGCKTKRDGMMQLDTTKAQCWAVIFTTVLQPRVLSPCRPTAARPNAPKPRVSAAVLPSVQATPKRAHKLS